MNALAEGQTARLYFELANSLKGTVLKTDVPPLQSAHVRGVRRARLGGKDSADWCEYQPADPLLAQKSSEADWINESFHIAEIMVYSGPIKPGDGPFPITQAYKDNAQKIANKRVELAGERLANLINNEMK